ncbi:hypothetical protein N7539_000676 [Penicillium diatomitis]|uniref:Uncharacterized protein n=1 Tax=Penicillium diatomitis TaxID=2819901 RepID=A0A9W9XN56_9EURO|nr:uncharacterized protein N7539_000676 [Penicillium diatomitis]KAJ5495560.1 hypothetical protein N7539_000676 [Penicillium diatomitis]
MKIPLRLKPSGLFKTLCRQPLSLPSSQITTSCRASRCRSYATSERLPKIADASVWTAMVPRFMMRNRKARKAGEPKEWNPATFYIVMFTLIGSQAIRLLTLKNSYTAYSRSADAKIKLLKDVIERVQKGEKVDVEKLLGTGDEAKEQEWEDVLRQIEEEDALWHSRQKALKEKEESARVAETQASAVQDTPKKDEATKDTPSTRKVNFF